MYDSSESAGAENMEQSEDEYTMLQPEATQRIDRLPMCSLSSENMLWITP